MGWADAFGVLATPAFGAIVVLGLVLLLIFLMRRRTAQNLRLEHEVRSRDRCHAAERDRHLGADVVAVVST